MNRPLMSRPLRKYFWPGGGRRRSGSAGRKGGEGRQEIGPRAVNFLWANKVPR
jgi:hypothetical protein